VYLAICGEALNAQRPGLRLPFSVRRAAELAGVDKNTAKAALDRLIERGLVRPVQMPSYLTARRFEIRWPFEVQNLGQWFSQEPGQVPGTSNTVPGTAPWLVWSQSVLGRTCQRLVECLERVQPRTDREWYEAAGVKHRAFYDNKHKLVVELWPLVVRDAEGIYRPVPDIGDRLKELAELSGATDRHKRKVQRHRVHRRGYAGYWLYATGLDERYDYCEGRLIDRVTGEVVRPEDVFSIDSRERAHRPVVRSIEAYRSSWVCPLVPHTWWAAVDRSKTVPVGVTVRAHPKLALAGTTVV
jgi:hypothetical protein